MRLLKDGKISVRIAAVNVLGSFGELAEQAIPSLSEMLLHEDDPVVLESLGRA